MPICQIPEYEMPIYRFLRGRAELVLSSGAFTLYEYLLRSDKTEYPLTVDDKHFSRDHLLAWASYNLQSETGGVFPEYARELDCLHCLNTEEIAMLKSLIHGISPIPPNALDELMFGTANIGSIHDRKGL